MAETDHDDLIRIIEEEPEGEIPETLPLMPVRDVVIFPDMLLPLFVGRERSISAVEAAVAGDNHIMLATQRDAGIENPTTEDIFEFGTVGRVLRMLKLPDGRVKALVQGVAKAKIRKYIRKRPLYRVNIDLIEEPQIEDVTVETEALMRTVRENSEKIMALKGELTGEVGSILESIEQPGKLADLVASNLRLKIEESQVLLETIDPIERVKKAGQDPVRCARRDLQKSAGLFSPGAGPGDSPGTGRK